MEFFVDRNKQPNASYNYQGTTLERTDTGSMHCLYWYYEICCLHFRLIDRISTKFSSDLTSSKTLLK